MPLECVADDAEDALHSRLLLLFLLADVQFTLSAFSLVVGAAYSFFFLSHYLALLRIIILLFLRAVWELLRRLGTLLLLLVVW